MVVKFFSKACCRSVAKNCNSIHYDKCNIWVTRECNKINKQTYKLPQKDRKSKWFCILCTLDCLHFKRQKH